MEQKFLPDEISKVVNSIVEQFGPTKIYIFSNKRGEKGKTAGFKLCVILKCDDRCEMEQKIYLGVESEVPFDIVLYSPEDWNALCESKGSFAQKIAKTGVLVYG